MTMITAPPIRARLPEELIGQWGRLDGVSVDGTLLTIDPAVYFFRFDNPSWVLCDWNDVRANLLEVTETPTVALEQQVLDYIETHGQRTIDPGEVLATAWQVYSYLFRAHHLSDPGLAGIEPRHLVMLRELATVMSLNRVELSGEITNVGPAWFFADTARVVFGLDQADAETLDEFYHGTFFNEARRVESVKAHAALGGRLVHGCQSAPNMSGGVVAPYGCDVAQFSAELAASKAAWRAAIHDG